MVNHEGRMIVFGGDRHHMPFNDMFALDLVNEFDRQSFQFVRDNTGSREGLDMEGESGKP